MVFRVPVRELTCSHLCLNLKKKNNGNRLMGTLESNKIETLKKKIEINA